MPLLTTANILTVLCFFFSSFSPSLLKLEVSHCILVFFRIVVCYDRMLTNALCGMVVVSFFCWFNQRHVSDIWATLAEAVGIHSSKGGSSGPADDPVAAAVGLPAVDSISFWQQAIGANTTAARAELLINGVYYDNTGLKLFGGAGDVSTTCAASVSIWVQVFSFFF